MRHSQSCQSMPSFPAAEMSTPSIVTTAEPSTTSVQLRRRKQQSQKELCQKLEEFRRKSRSTVVNPDDVKIVSSGSSARPARAKSEEVAYKNQVRDYLPLVFLLPCGQGFFIGIFLASTSYHSQII